MFEFILVALFVVLQDEASIIVIVIVILIFVFVHDGNEILFLFLFCGSARTCACTLARQQCFLFKSRIMQNE